MAKGTFSELDKFKWEVNLNLALNSDIELIAVDNEGKHPVVVALESEKLSTLVKRIEACGGFANVFVKERGNKVVTLQVVDTNHALDAKSAEDMTGHKNQPSGEASIGIFLDLLRTIGKPVKLPRRLSDMPVEKTITQPMPVELEKV